MSSFRALAAAAALAGLAAGPANALSTEQMPTNANGAPRFADSDAAFDQMADDYQNGRMFGSQLGFADGVSRHQSSHERAATVTRSDPNNPYACIDCRSVEVDGVWLLQSQRANAASGDQ